MKIFKNKKNSNTFFKIIPPPFFRTKLFIEFLLRCFLGPLARFTIWHPIFFKNIHLNLSKKVGQMYNNSNKKSDNFIIIAF